MGVVLAMGNDIHHNQQTAFTYYIAQSPSPTPSPTPTPNSGQQPPGLDWTTIIVAIVGAVITGVSTGFLSALVTPWSKLTTDIKREERESVRTLIQHWREYIKSSSSLLYLKDDVLFHDLVQRLKPAVYEELLMLTEQ
jgi:hypothetical protein